MRAETFAFFVGIVYFAIGLLGFVPEALMLAPPDSPPVHLAVLSGYLLGMFPVNVVHSAVHLGVGGWGILAGRSIASPKIYARSLAILFGALALLGVTPSMNTLFGLVPLHGDDIWLHIGTAAAAAYIGWNPAAWTNRRAAGARDRRESSLPVDRDRRARDRRLPASEI
jgi:hypothetical protein